MTAKSTAYNLLTCIHQEYESRIRRPDPRSAGTGDDHRSPRARVHGTNAAILTATTSWAASSVTSVVIYEADDLMRALLEEWLRGAGYRVHCAASHGAPARDDADLVIVSLYMPKHAGARLVCEIREAYPRAPLVAISAQFRSGLSSAGATAQTLGVAQVIAKPLTRDALLATVRGIIGPPA
jgi:CheY-like chemotaxis protein